MKKLLLFLLCALLSLCLFSCADENTPDVPPDPPANAYASVIARYTALAEARGRGEAVAAADGADEIERALCTVVAGVEEDAVLGYATKDIDGDGKEELVLLDKESMVKALFTQKEGAPVLLLVAEDVASISADGTVYSASLVGEDGGIIRHFEKLTNGVLSGLTYAYIPGEETAELYKIENGVRTEITYNERDALERQYETIISFPYLETKTAAFRFIPAIPSDAAADAPVADFSSYDTILSAYARIVGCYSDYTVWRWSCGEYDDLFVFPDNESYEIFHAIFTAGSIARPTEERFGSEYALGGDNAYGYAKHDLNGDGTEELILLTDMYRILAVFTEKNGRAVLLPALSAKVGGRFNEVWINEVGELRSTVETGGATLRDAEKYLYRIKDGGAECVFGVGYAVNGYLEKVNWYRIENGKHVPISDEEGKALYARFDALPYGREAKEHMRTVSGITFIPLFERTLGSARFVGEYTNRSMIYGDVLTVTAATADRIEAAFECVWVGDIINPEEPLNRENVRTTLSFSAVREEGGHRYLFDTEGVSGYIELGARGAWVVVTQSENEYVLARAYCLNSLRQ